MLPLFQAEVLVAVEGCRLRNGVPSSGAAAALRPAGAAGRDGSLDVVFPLNLPLKVSLKTMDRCLELGLLYLMQRGSCRRTDQSTRELTRATLKSKALLRSAKFIPRKAWRLVAGSSMRRTKLREESTAASTAAVRWPLGMGHSPKISPLQGAG